MPFTGKTQTFLDTDILNDGFFPVLNLGEFQRIYRVPAEYETETVIYEVESAKNTINCFMQVNKEVWLLGGAQSLSDVLPDNPLKDLVALYKAAVYCLAKAELLKQFPTFIRREAAENAAKESDDTRDYWLSRSGKATRALLGKGQITVELI